VRNCDLQTSATRLRRATRELMLKWEETKSHWNDDANRDFETNHLQPLLPQLSLTVNVVQRLNELLERAERECEDRQGM